MESFWVHSQPGVQLTILVIGLCLWLYYDFYRYFVEPCGLPFLSLTYFLLNLILTLSSSLRSGRPTYWPFSLVLRSAYSIPHPWPSLFPLASFTWKWILWWHWSSIPSSLQGGCLPCCLWLRMRRCWQTFAPKSWVLVMWFLSSSSLQFWLPADTSCCSSPSLVWPGDLLRHCSNTQGYKYMSSMSTTSLYSSSRPSIPVSTFFSS